MVHDQRLLNEMLKGHDNCNVRIGTIERAVVGVSACMSAQTGLS